MKTRLNIYLSPGQHEEIAALSAKRRVSKSSVIETAVASMLSPDSADVREAAFVRRLDRHTRQLERVERDLAIVMGFIYELDPAMKSDYISRVGWRRACCSTSALLRN